MLIWWSSAFFRRCCFELSDQDKQATSADINFWKRRFPKGSQKETFITAIENGDTKDAIQMIEEIKEESKEIIKPINLN